MLLAAVGSPAYPPLAAAGHVNGVDLTWTAKLQGETLYTISTLSGGGCTAAEAEAQTCNKIPALQWKDGAVPEIEITANVPAPADLSTLNDAPPAKIIAYLCFSPPSAKNKKWRKINDVFKKDNSCSLSTVLQDTDAVEYPDAANPALSLGTLKLVSKAPTAHFTIRAAVMCEGAAKNEFCHVTNRQPSALTPEQAALEHNPAVYFPTVVMDSRPTKLYVAVFICAFIGPVIFLSFMIYERGFLAKQA